MKSDNKLNLCPEIGQVHFQGGQPLFYMPIDVESLVDDIVEIEKCSVGDPPFSEHDEVMHFLECTFNHKYFTINPGMWESVVEIKISSTWLPIGFNVWENT